MIGMMLVDEHLDRKLRELLGQGDHLRISTFNDMNSPGRPLGSIWAKVRLAYLLGIVTDTAFAMIERMRKIRNQFAHSYESSSLGDPNVTKLVSELPLLDKTLEMALEQDRSKGPVPSRDVFIFTVCFVCGVIDAYSDRRSVGATPLPPVNEN